MAKKGLFKHRERKWEGKEHEGKESAKFEKLEGKVGERRAHKMKEKFKKSRKGKK